MMSPANYPPKFGPESLDIPVYCAKLSALILVLHAVFLSPPVQKSISRLRAKEQVHRPSAIGTRRYQLVYGIARFCGCVTLVGLAFISSRFRRQEHAGELETLQLRSEFVYVYASILAFIAISARGWSTVVTRHLNMVLAVTFFAFVHRDLFPLATFSQPQLDFFIVTAIGIVLPLLVPRNGSLDDKRRPSLISLITFTFLDPVILLASRVPHLSYELLPQLPISDDAMNLKTTTFPHLDVFLNKKRRHIFLVSCESFRAEYAIMLLLSVVQVATNFGSPVAINRLLELKAAAQVMRPWFWILLLFVGPTVGSMATQWNKYVYNQVSIQTEAILTELVFEHSLRVRPSEPGGRNLVGKINNLATIDLQNIVNSGEMPPRLLAYLLQSCLGVWFLYEVLGWAAFVGLGVTVAAFPLPGYIGGRIRFVQQGLMERTDARVQTVSETMSLLRMIKLFAWEKKTEERISRVRNEELNWLWKSKALQLSIAIVNFSLPILTMLATYATYVTVIMKQELNASKVFSSMTVFDMFRAQLHEFFATMTSLVTGRVSLDRLDDFLRQTELLDVCSDESTSNSFPLSDDNDTIGFTDAAFSWSTGDTTPTGANQPRFLLRIDGSLFFKRNCINLIVGPTGSGKTSILMALLGEMHYIPLSRDSWFNLPRGGGIAYAAQQSWVQNDTIKANILFGAEFDAQRYNKVIYQCGLQADLAMFEAGDLQEVGEGGLTLSGGQRARVTLARAVYSSASILLLDDVFAALDVHTSQWIIDNCLAGDLLKNRTTLLITHNITLVQPITGFMVSLRSDGHILSKGTISDALAKNSDLVLKIIEESNTQLLTEDVADQSVDKLQAGGKLVVAEEIEIGHVSWAALKLYLSALGGRSPSLYFAPLILCMLLTDTLINAQTWYLGYFASQYDDHKVSQVRVAYHLSVYGGILFLTLLIYSCSYLIYLFGMVRASNIIHTEFIQSILGTTLRFLDATPTSRIIARSTQDLRDVDTNIGQSLWAVLDLIFYASIRLGAIVVLVPPFLIPAIILLLAGTWIGSLYTKAQLSVKREMSNARAPVLGHFGAAIEGLVSIRAYGAQEAFINISLEHINRYTRTSRTFQSLSRWVAVRLDLFGTVLTTLLATYMVYFQKQDSSSVGFSLNMASGFGMIILFGVSLERIKQYLEIEHEIKPTASGVPPAYWPSSGDLRAENLSARYSADGPTVLSGISFDIKGGERVGIVGRTGSGKSSLTLALLRAIVTEGTVYYDGISTSALNLEAVRRNITIIPQTPELLNGTLRINLDPLGEHDDATLNDALRAAGLFSLQWKGAQITLDTMLASGGVNLSMGQRQILALTRALIRGSKVLILDEDYETDKVIQESLRTGLGKDVTVLTVAHRLHSIMRADRIVEFASPHELLANQAGALRALVDESQDKDVLYSMASEQRG
ncbi:multidrug resistance-associated ABC transporter [Mycena alexandri]|uniref:Multidrug resistance-associated ABC transporter n=1 Tax=Mycena alexandri TaxID=1745969 RepID=A0AAD6TAV5_9AGAR|nr:multidrug resistance-associated ABC transporter [Mycena alexandri]